MKVFISWSGEVSLEMAKVLKEWIPCVIPCVETYFSSDDIDKGARWSTDIAKELEVASFGVLCVTKDNLKSPWLNFEAGALSKAVDKSKVCPLLFHLKPSDISNSPILQFQMANTERDDLLKLFKSINSSLGDSALEESRIEKVFDLCWLKMQMRFSEIENIIDKKEDVDTDSTNILEEMLELLRYQHKFLNNPEQVLPPQYLSDIIFQVKEVRRPPEDIIDRIRYCEKCLKEELSQLCDNGVEITDKYGMLLSEYFSYMHSMFLYFGHGAATALFFGDNNIK